MGGVGGEMREVIFVKMKSIEGEYAREGF